jgi:hypothetical protein
VRIREGVGEIRGGWFRESILKKVGDEVDIFFGPILSWVGFP